MFLTRALLCSSRVTSLKEHLCQKIKATGPLTVANYMKEALTNPLWGYYMRKDVFGEKGDFTTSPEISQVFGEMIGVWYLNQWLQTGQPEVMLVELGPGRGTLMADILRVLGQFKATSNKFSVHFVEVSEAMMNFQKKNLGASSSSSNSEFATSAVSSSGVPIHWYKNIQEVPKGPTFFLAHEFFDALPIHLFKRQEGKWREVLVGIKDSEDLQLVVSPGPSALSNIFIPSNIKTNECEVCPEGAVTMSLMSQTVKDHGGCGLIVDYGEVGSNRHSIRGFKKHELVEDIFKEPGEADLTANVDFGFLQRHCVEGVACHGPIQQQSFLMQMGIRERVQALLKVATREQSKQIASGLKHLIAADGMGSKFKVMSFTRTGDPVPAAFG